MLLPLNAQLRAFTGMDANLVRAGEADTSELGIQSQREESRLTPLPKKLLLSVRATLLGSTLQFVLFLILFGRKFALDPLRAGVHIGLHAPQQSRQRCVVFWFGQNELGKVVLT